MKNLSKFDQLHQLPHLHSPTTKDHSKKPTPLISYQPASLNEIFEDDHPKLKSPIGSERKFGSLTARNFSLGESRTLNHLTVSAFTPKTLKNINMGKKIIRIEKFNMMERITDLKSSLQKYKGQDLQLLAPLKNDIKKTIKCLEVLNESDSVMTGVMDLVIKVLKGSIYVNPDMFGHCRETLMNCENEELRKITVSAEQSFVPYYAFCLALINELIHQDMKRAEEKRYSHARIEELTRAVEKKDRELAELHEKVNKAITKDVYGQILDELRVTRDKCGTFFEENKILKTNLMDLIEENKYLSKQYENEGLQVETHLAQIAELKEKDILRLDEIEEYKVQIQQLEKKITNVDNVMSITIDKIEEIKRQISAVQQRNDDLNFQNQRLLFKVSATGIEAFTPRPDYKSLQEDKKIELDMFDITGKIQTRSTAAVFEELMSRLADQNSKNSDSPHKSTFSQQRATHSRSQSRSRTGGNFATNSPSRFSRQVIENNASGPGPGKSIFAARIFSRNSVRGGNSTPNPQNSKPRGSHIFTPNVKANSSFNFDEQAIKDATQTHSPQGRVLSLKDDPVSSLVSLDNSPSEVKSDSGENKYTLKIEIPKMRKNISGGETIESADELIQYIMHTKEGLVVGE